MDENDSKGFKISFDDDETGSSSPIETETESIFEKKLRQRITLVAVLLLIFILGSLFFVYQRLDQKMLVLQNSGMLKVESLTQTLELTIKELTGQTDQLKERIQKETDKLDKKIKSVSGSLGKNKSTLNKSVSEKANKKELEKTAAALNKKIKSLDQRLEKASSDIKAVETGLNQELKKQLAGLSKNLDTMGKDMASLKQEIQKLPQMFIDQKKLEFELDLQAKRYKTEMRQAEIDFKKKLDELEKKIESSRKIKKLISSPVTATPPAPAAQPPATGGKTINGIIENDLSE